MVQMTVLNSLKFPVDAARFALTQQEVEQIKAHGIYAEPFTTILPYLELSASEKWLSDAWRELAGVVLSVPGDALAGALLAVSRPQYNTDPTFVEYQDAVPDCDTNSYKDVVKMLSFLMRLTVGCLVRRVVGDGQTVLMLKNVKCKRPDRYKSTWIDLADMHCFAHSIYAGDNNMLPHVVNKWRLIVWCKLVCAVCTVGHFLFWQCFLQACANKLQRRTMEENPKNLEEDKFERHKVFDLIVFLATMVFFVKHFPREVVASPARLSQLCSRHAGLMVMFQYAFTHGCPILSWWTATRSNRFSVCDIAAL